LSNLGFTWMAIDHGNIGVFAVCMVTDNFANGIAETALMAFMTKMTSREHSMTHYALMYGVAALTGKFLKGFSGLAVDQLTPYDGLFVAYQIFFLGTALVAVPCVWLCLSLKGRGVYKDRTSSSGTA
jgi:MFS transporter, PAT family, beta-lactamase induction signal transducer AmpG